MTTTGPLAATAEVAVDATPQDAFAIFTDEIALWWRADSPYWNDRERARSLKIEPFVGGRFVEVYDVEAGTGFEIGRVTAWEPGRRLGLTWTQADWPDGMATEIEVTFAAEDGATRVRLEQRGFEAAPNPEATAGGYDAGWKEILGWFAERAGGAGS